MTVQVKITKGFYRNEPVAGVFELLHPYKVGKRGGTVTISNPNPMKDGKVYVTQRVTVSPGDFVLLDAAGNELPEGFVVPTADTPVASNGTQIVASGYEAAFTSTETDEEAMERIKKSFGMLDRITDSVAKGTIRGLVVSGPPGVGKSYGVEAQLEKANMFLKIAHKDPKYEVISGGVSPIGLFQKLYYNRSSEFVTVFDDCDGVFQDEECLNLMKAALNSGDKRRICWNKESRVLKVDDIPEVFDFEGGIIFITNVDFEKSIARGSRIGAHLAAIMSRCHYMDLEIGSMRDKLLRIKQIIKDGMLNPYGFNGAQDEEIFEFISTNSEHMREISLRTVKKTADFVKSDPTDWMDLAESTLLVREAKFKRLLAKRQEAESRGLVLTDV